MNVLLLILGFALAVCGAETNDVSPTVHVLVVGKAMPNDTSQMLERAQSAVSRVSAAVKQSCPEAIVEELAECAMTVQQVRSGEVCEQVTGAILQEKFLKLAASVKPADTVIVYTHTHGHKHGAPGTESLGGMVIELPMNRPDHRGMMFWDEYADLLLNIPAKNVIVLTMSCYSGGLVEILNSPGVKERWEGRREEGRNFIVLTSQNAEQMSTPIKLDGEVINPFTVAVLHLFAGEADGFSLVEEAPVVQQGDGTLALGELVDFVLYTTEHAVSEIPQRGNSAKPQVTGSYQRDAVLNVSAGE
jgi:hypothetical protein